MVENSGTIFGVEKPIIEGFLRLIKEKYPLAAKANYFLEVDLGVSGINVAIANQRDVLSHFSEVLSRNTELTLDEKKEQLHFAEEHIRRSVSETYQKACNILIDRVRNIRKVYIEKVLPLREIYLTTAPSSALISSEWEQIKNLYEEGRKAKSINNIWSPDWEKGIGKFVEACNYARNHEEKLEEYIIKAKQYEKIREDKKHSRKQTILTIWSIVTTVLLGIVTILFSYFYTQTPKPQQPEPSSIQPSAEPSPLKKDLPQNKKPSEN